MTKYDYQSIKELAKSLDRPASSLVALSERTDPFYLPPARMRNARWFAELYHGCGFQNRVHVRRIHYTFVSQDPPRVMPNGRRYQNTTECSDFLGEASLDARYAGLVSIADFIDQKNPDPILHPPEEHYGEPEVEAGTDDGWGTVGLAMPSEIPQPRLSLSKPDCPPQPYHVEIWIEKSTMNDILVPHAQRYKINIQALTGETSLTLCRDLVDRAGGRPVRILYVSDFDPGGQSMPLAAARKIE